MNRFQRITSVFGLSAMAILPACVNGKNERRNHYFVPPVIDPVPETQPDPNIISQFGISDAQLSDPELSNAAQPSQPTPKF